MITIIFILFFGCKKSSFSWIFKILYNPGKYKEFNKHAFFPSIILTKQYQISKNNNAFLNKNPK